MTGRERFRMRLKKVSVTLTIAYTCVFLAGVAFTIATPATIEDTSVRWQSYVWAAFLIVGGGLSASDLFTGRRGGELFGSLPIAGATGLFGVALLHKAQTSPGLADARTGLGWLMIGFAMFVVARYIMLKTEFDAAKVAKPRLG